MIILISSKFFMLNFFMTKFFYYFNALRLFNPRIKLFMYIFIIMSFFFYLIIKIDLFAFVEVKPISQLNLMIILF